MGAAELEHFGMDLARESPLMTLTPTNIDTTRLRDRVHHIPRWVPCYWRLHEDMHDMLVLQC